MTENNGPPDPEITRAWLEALTEAVDLLLRQSERSLEKDAKEGFTTSSPSALLLVQVEQTRVREARSRLQQMLRVPVLPKQQGVGGADLQQAS
jgi:hypothetical protein